MSFGTDASYLFSSSSSSLLRRAGVPRGYGGAAGPFRAEEAAGLREGPGEGPRATRESEKQQLQGLNDRFAGYIEKVRSLEQRNRALEAELGAARQRAAEQPRLAALFQAEVRELRARLEGSEAARAEAALERERLAREAERLAAAGEAEAAARGEAEAALRARQREAEDDALDRLALERQREALLAELAFARQAHAEELAEARQALPPPARAEPAPEPPRAELTGALRELRAQYEGLAARNLQAAEEWFRGKCASLSQQAARHADAVRASREEAGEYRRQLQARSLEAETLRGAHEALERQLHDVEERHHAEALGLQDNIHQLESDLRETKSEMTQHLREYQDLLNVKMALDIEIAAYRKLLEGEETRFSTSSINISSMNPISNPVYSFQPRLFSSPVVSSSKMSFKKEEKEEGRLASKMSSSQGGEAFAEVIEETITSTKKTERTNLEEGNMANPKM